MTQGASYRRFVALGDSQTEGLDDLRADGSPRGWADRLAEQLAATTSPGLRYANLAVRGCRARHVHDVQLPRALDLAPDLASVAVGMNDLLRHDYDLDATIEAIESTVVALREAGAHVVSMTSPDVAKMLPVMGWLAGRQRAFHDRLREVHRRHGVPTLELAGLPMGAARELWAADRIHGSPEGHRRVAAGMARLLDLPGSDDSWSEVGPTRLRPVRLVAGEARWAATFLGPWLAGQVRRRPPGSEPVCKRPDLVEVTVER
ncbi:SGNH/GDSL hydrolase family protein [Nocardioides sp. C4-1]|uniref:SGNH/GDSL hydrolase family protein n=1 Tax=Nocardioides sp. C4-1 TaxID=3151851 RepID=UPI003267F020